MGTSKPMIMRRLFRNGPRKVGWSFIMDILILAFNQAFARPMKSDDSMVSLQAKGEIISMKFAIEVHAFH